MYKLFLCLLLLGCGSFSCLADTVWLDSIEMDQALPTHSNPQRNLNALRQPLIMGGKTYTTGVGVAARSLLWIDLGHGSGRFKATVGLDDACKSGAAEFVITIDDQQAWSSGVMHPGDAPKPIDIDTNGKRYMALAVENRSGGGGEELAKGESGQVYADWCDARWETQWSDPVEARGEASEPYILTPSAGAQPRLNNALVYGTRPGRPMQYTIPCTGARPIKFQATGLPPGVSLDALRGWLVGRPKRVGRYQATLTATNNAGQSVKPMEIVVGDQLALTPPMGWSSWNVWCAAPSQDKVLSAARSMVKYDLIDHGFAYINIDDGWEGQRGGKYHGIQAAGDKFADVHAMIDQVHAMGLKLGIYSGPWINSYCGYNGGSSDSPDGAWTTAMHSLPNNGWIFGKYNFASDDAKEWASWGVDYLKYDWYPNDEPHVAAMSDALHATGRNIVYSLSNSAHLEMGPMLVKYAQLWRASDDIRDNWASLYSNGFSQSPWAKYAGPGHWADPDMMVLGHVGFGSDWGQTTHATHLTPDEQYTHMSMWCLLAAPLILGCDLAKLDPFTVGLLTNDDVIAVDQDPLGRAATRISGDTFHEVWMRPLRDGSVAVGIFNLAPGGFPYSVSLSELGLAGSYTARDLWREKDLGAFGSTFTTDVPGHGVRFIRLIPAKPSAAHV